ncbi:MAG: hypothetical protein RR255_00305 [Bacilli bacterium]
MAHEDLNIKERLDLLDKGIDGVRFKKEIKNGWTVFTSYTGLITATYELDIRPIVLSSTDVTGLLKADKTVKENFPVGLFKEVVNVDIKMYSVDNPTFVFQDGLINLYTKDYTGEYRIMGYNSKFDSSAIIPTSVHVLITAIGF